MRRLTTDSHRRRELLGRESMVEVGDELTRRKASVECRHCFLVNCREM